MLIRVLGYRSRWRIRVLKNSGARKILAMVGDGVSSEYDAIGYSRLGAVTAAIAEMIDGCWRVQVRLVARGSERDGVWQLESAPQLVPPLRFAA